MKILPRYILTAALLLLACSILPAPFVTAADCDRPGRPDANSALEHPIGDVGTVDDKPPITVYFQDRSQAPRDQPVASWHWEFGDGTTSANQNPRHTYTTMGVYTVSLTVTTVCGSPYSDTFEYPLNVYCTFPDNRFTTDVTEGYAPLTVHVTDDSEHAPDSVSEWTYWFDNTHHSHEKNPSFTYTKPGTYTINQTIRKSCTNPEAPLHVTKKTVTVYGTVGIIYTLFPNLTSGTTTGTAPVVTTTAAPAVTTSREPVAAVTTGGIPVAPAAAGTGTLTVRTDPAGAEVYLDDVLRGASPAIIPNLAAGSHILRLEREGYQTMRVPVTISDGKTTEYSTALIPDSSGGKRAAPLGAAAAVIACAGAGAYLYMKKKKAP